MQSNLADFKIGQGPPESRLRTRELYTANSWYTRSAPEKLFAAVHLQLDMPLSTKMGHRVPRHDREPEWSYATTFARGGLEPGHGLKGRYLRDVHTGVWHKEKLRKVDGPISAPVPGTRLEMARLSDLSVYLKKQPM